MNTIVNCEHEKEVIRLIFLYEFKIGDNFTL